jgi:hypothetical protein
MKEKSQILLFAACLVFIAVLLRYCSGPFYFGNNSDPSYFYLYNFLYILEGKSLEFVDHPGATLDMLGAAVVRIFFAPHQNTLWLSTNALCAEEVLGLVWFLLIAIYAGSFVLLGFYAFKKSQDRVFTGLILLSSLWLMAVRSFSGTGILPISANVNSDTMMMSADNLMLLAILRFYFSSKPGALVQAVILGAAVAFGIATKFTALPLLAVAACVLVTWQQRILLLAVATAGFIVLTWPLWGSYAHMIGWVKGLIVARGMHGYGGEGFDARSFVEKFYALLKEYWFFVAGWILAGVTALKGRHWSIDPKIRRVLLAVAAGGFVQLVIVSKQTAPQYMTPMIGLSSLTLAFLYKAFPGWWQKGLKHIVAIVLVVSIALTVISLWRVNETTQKTWAMLSTITRDYSDCRVCPFYRSSTPGFGFVFWNNVIHRDDYGAILNKYYPGMVYYDVFGKDFKDVTQQVVPLSVLRQGRSRVLIYGQDEDPQNFEPNLTVKKIYQEGTEALYEVISQQSNRATEFLQFAMILYSQGRYEDALKAAFVSQQLGVGKDISGFIELLKRSVQAQAKP